MQQLREWFSLEHCSKSAAQFDFEKLKWINNHYLRLLAGQELAEMVAPRVREEGFSVANGPQLAAVCELLKDRAQTLNELAESVAMFYMDPRCICGFSGAAQPAGARGSDRAAGQPAR